MGTGIIIAAIIDIFLLLILATLNIVFMSNYGVAWFMVVIIADILLIVGTHSKNSGLLIFWLIIAMINIVFLFIGWIAFQIIFVASAVIKVVENCNNANGNSQNCNVNDADDGFKGFRVVMYMSLVFIIILPCYYIYLWVVVKSHRENLVRGETGVLPIHGHQGQQMFIITNGLVQQQHQSVMLTPMHVRTLNP